MIQNIWLSSHFSSSFTKLFPVFRPFHHLFADGWQWLRDAEPAQWIYFMIIQQNRTGNQIISFLHQVFLVCRVSTVCVLIFQGQLNQIRFVSCQITICSMTYWHEFSKRNTQIHQTRQPIHQIQQQQATAKKKEKKEEQTNETFSYINILIYRITLTIRISLENKCVYALLYVQRTAYNSMYTMWWW